MMDHAAAALPLVAPPAASLARRRALRPGHVTAGWALLAALVGCSTEPASEDAGADATALDSQDGTPLDTNVANDSSATTDDAQADAASDAADEDAGADTSDDGETPQDAVADAQTTAVACADDDACASLAAPCRSAHCGKSGVCVVVWAADGADCSDGDTCTVGDGCKQGACVGAEGGCGCSDDAGCAKFASADLCAAKPVCNTTTSPGVCELPKAPAVVCEDDGTLCAPIACDPATGTCVAKPATDGTPCEDGTLCTTDSTCKGGSCQGGVDVCVCSKDADCAGFEDGNLCNGTLVCDTSGLVPTCKVKGSTIVVCPGGNAKDCTTQACDPATGGCVPGVAADGSACSDGDPCSVDDVCKAGSCTAGKAVCGCKVTADCAASDDGNPCNGSLYCDIQATPPVCKVFAPSVPTCDTSKDGACKATSCDPTTGGCVTLPIQGTAVCDDGNDCSGGDTCANGSCVGATTVCTCVSDADCAAHDPKNLCLGSLYCDTSKPGAFVCRPNPATPIVCPSHLDTVCSKNRCQPSDGSCKFEPAMDGTSCNADGNPCTQGDSCQSGSCKVGPNVCPCEADADCKGSEDGDFCNGTLYCDTGAEPKVCTVNPKTVVTCPGGQFGPCKANLCQPKTGLCAPSNLTNGVSCDADGNACTIGDACSGGTCVAGPSACACNVDADCKAFDDGDLCNGVPYCDKTALPYACKPNPATVVTCDPSKDTDCSVAVCDPAKGTCSPAPVDNNTPCDDGQPCTVGDVCTNGSCTPGVSSCGCTSDAQCDQIDDGNPCNGVLACDKTALPWTCKPKAGSVVVCPDLQLPCAAMVCQPSSGTCIAEPILAKAGKPCEDGDACTDKQTCVGLLCSGGVLKTCDDGKICTLDSCDSTLGCQNKALTGPPCQVDGAAGLCNQGVCQSKG